MPFQTQEKKIPAVQDISLQVEKAKSSAISAPTVLVNPPPSKCLPESSSQTKDRFVSTASIRKKIARLSINKSEFSLDKNLTWIGTCLSRIFYPSRKIYDVPDKVFKERLAVLIDLLDLADIMKQPIRNLSLGQRVRCEFAAIFIHQPAVVFGRTNHRLGCQRQGDHSLLHPLYESRIPDHFLDYFPRYEGHREPL